MTVEYFKGHIKRDPVSGACAIRTVFSDVDFPHLAWLIATEDVGPRTVGLSAVEDWDDLFVPEVVHE